MTDRPDSGWWGGWWGVGGGEGGTRPNLEYSALLLFRSVSKYFCVFAYALAATRWAGPVVSMAVSGEGGCLGWGEVGGGLGSFRTQESAILKTAEQTERSEAAPLT